MAHLYVVTLAEGRKSQPTSEADILALYKKRRITAECVVTNTKSGTKWSADEFFQDHAAESDKKLFSTETAALAKATREEEAAEIEAHRMRPIPTLAGAFIGTLVLYVGTLLAVGGTSVFFVSALQQTNETQSAFFTAVAGIGAIAWARTYQAILHQRELLQWQCEFLLRAAEKWARIESSD